MCIENTLQQHILNITNGGKTIADFFHATMQGQNPRAQVHHQMEAAKHLTKLALTYTPSPSTGEGWDGGEASARPEHVEGPVEGLDGNTAHEPYDSSFLRKQESTVETADTAEKD